MRFSRALSLLGLGTLTLTGGLGASPAVIPSASASPTLLVEAHAGGQAYHPPNTLAAFDTALRQGADSLELDVQITADGHDVLTHDAVVSDEQCRDTRPAFPGDPEYPYVGKFVRNLTLAQVETLDCGHILDPSQPKQRVSPDGHMPRLSEIFDLVKRHRAGRTQVSIEAKVEAGARWQTAPADQFAHVVARAIDSSGIRDQITVRSFDWSTLTRVRALDRRVPLIALTEPDFLEVGKPGRSPWLGGLDIDDFGGDPVKAAHFLGFDRIAPVHGTPQEGTVHDPSYVPFTTKAMVDEAHRLGMTVIPWTVNDTATTKALLHRGVDGITTDDVPHLQGILDSWPEPGIPGA